MTMIRRADGKTGRIDSFTKEDDKAIVCMACSHIIVSQTNLTEDGGCPYCHQPVNVRLGAGSLVADDTDDIAKPC